MKSDGEKMGVVCQSLYRPQWELKKGIFREVGQKIFPISELLYIYQPGVF